MDGCLLLILESEAKRGAYVGNRSRSLWPRPVSGVLSLECGYLFIHTNLHEYVCACVQAVLVDHSGPLEDIGDERYLVRARTKHNRGI